jgi:hypothetical protein
MNASLENMKFGELSRDLFHPSVIIQRAVDSLGFEYIKEHYPHYLDAMIQKLPLKRWTVEKAVEYEELRARLIDRVCSISGSYSFDMANNFIERFHNAEEMLISIFTGKDCLRLVCEINSAASHGAWRAEEVIASKFKSLTKLRDKTIQYLDENSEDALAFLEEKRNEPISIKEFKARLLNSVEPPVD